MDNEIELDPSSLDWIRIFFRDSSGCPYAKDVNSYDWNILKSKGFGITSCTINHTSKYVTDIRCTGVHPNVNPNTGKFCINAAIPFDDKAVGEIIYMLKNPNLISWYTEREMDDKWNFLFNMLDQEDETITHRIA